MPNLKPPKTKLTENLELAINNVRKPDQVGGLQAIRASLSALRKARLIDAIVWANYLRGIHNNSEFTEEHRGLLFTGFADFTDESLILEQHLSQVIRQPKDGYEEPSTAEESGEEEDVSELADSPEDAFPGIDTENGPQRPNTPREMRKTWQEWVGSKILEKAPHLITPPPLQVGLKGYNVKTSKCILKLAVINNADWVIPPNLSHLDVEYQDRIIAFLDPPAGSETLLKTAVELSHASMIKKLIQLLKAVGIDQTERSDLLHAAIADNRPGIAKLLVNECPEMIEQTPSGESALQLLKRIGSFPKDADLEDFLISKTLRRKPPALVRKLLPNQIAKELYVDLTVFNDRSNHDFDAFLNSLKDTKEIKYLVQFISTLMYVEMPRMCHQPANPNREEAFVVLNWLRTKSVKSILELHVPDSLSSPHPDEGIQKWLSVPESENGFREIETLNWEKLDLPLETLKKVPGLQKVYLYSANWNTLIFWSGSEGLCCEDYKHITEAIIVVVQDNISEDRAKFLKEETEKRFEDLAPKRRKISPFNYEVKISKWDVGENESHEPDVPLTSAITPKQIIGLERFLRQDPRPAFRQNTSNARPTRVAIIDNGVDAGISKIWARVAACRSFVEVSETRESSCWLASDSHGTQMASIVTDIDPHCLLYIAKVGTDRRSKPNPDDVAEAIKWVATEKVDIIIISMTFDDNDEAIEKAITAAYDGGKGSVIFCATEDVGNAGKDVFPAYLGQTIAISACNRAGKQAKYTDPLAQYWFQGYEIHADSLSYGLSESEAPKGSSVANAIAGGVASLILSFRYQADPEGRGRKTRKETIEKVFTDMTAPNDKYVSPRRFFKLGYEDKAPWSTEQWAQWIQDKFRPGDQYV